MVDEPATAGIQHFPRMPGRSHPCMAGARSRTTSFNIRHIAIMRSDGTHQRLITRKSRRKALPADVRSPYRRPMGTDGVLELLRRELGRLRDEYVADGRAAEFDQQIARLKAEGQYPFEE